MTEKKWYRFFYAIVWPFVMLFYPMKFIGRENIPEGGALVCANHSAAVDPFFLAFALGRKKRICAMAKESLLNIFFVGKVLKLIGTFGVRRGASDIHAVKYALEELKKGEYVVIFPEGTRVKSQGRRRTQNRRGHAGLPNRGECAARLYSHEEKALPHQPGVHRQALQNDPRGQARHLEGLRHIHR